MDPEIYRYVQLAWIIIHLLLLLPLYLSRSSIANKSKFVKYLATVLGFGVVGTAVIIYENIVIVRTTELAIVLGFPALALIVYFLPSLLTVLTDERTQSLSIRSSATHNVLVESISAISKNIEEKGNLEIEAKIKPNRWYEFNFVIKPNETNKNQISRELIPTGTTTTNFRILTFLAYYSVIIPITTNSFDLPIPFLNYTIDAEVSFFTISVLMLIFLNYIKSIQTQFQDEFTEIQEVAKVNLAKKLATNLQKGSSSKDDSSDDEKSAVDRAKEKALSIKDLRLKEEIKRKQEEMKNQIDSILGNDENESKHFDNELYRKQLMIKKVQRILNSTPIGKEIKLRAVMDKVESEDEELIESVIMGLVSSNRVKGKYDVWERRFLVGDASSRFIEQALENLRVSPQDFDSIKISKSGDVEISFNQNGKVTHNVETTDEEEDSD